MIHIPELDITVEDVDQFNDEATQILEEFTDTLAAEPGMTEKYDPGTEEGLYCIGLGYTFFYPDAATKKIDAEYNRLWQIGIKYFNEKDIDISNSRITEDI